MEIDNYFKLSPYSLNKEKKTSLFKYLFTRINTFTLFSLLGLSFNIKCYEV